MRMEAKVAVQFNIYSESSVIEGCIHAVIELLGFYVGEWYGLLEAVWIPVDLILLPTIVAGPD